MDFKVNPAVTETKVVEVFPATYTVTLTEKEAAVIASLIGAVNGSLDDSGVAASIRFITVSSTVVYFQSQHQRAIYD